MPSVSDEQKVSSKPFSKAEQIKQLNDIDKVSILPTFNCNEYGIHMSNLSIEYCSTPSVCRSRSEDSDRH